MAADPTRLVPEIVDRVERNRLVKRTVCVNVSEHDD